MPVYLATSVDMIANSVSLCDENSVANVWVIFLKKTFAMQQITGAPPEKADKPTT